MKSIETKGATRLLPRADALCAILMLACFSLSAQPIWGSSPISEPYPYASAGTFSGPAVAQSPDPLIAYRWADPKASDGLEIYLLKPRSVSADTAGSFDNLQSLTSNTPDVTVKGPGSIRLDFGQENAAWLEFDSPDLTGSVEMSISEYNEPARVNSGPANPVKTRVPVRYGSTYRLELNSELYEGVRFGWIHVNSFTTQWHITGVRLVCQVKPTNYNGSFACSDTMLTRIWYTGAYGVKLNLLEDYFGAILMDRGDRYSWTGDAHPSQAASLVAFGNFDFVKQNIDYTAGQSNGIRSYSLYWVLSLIDYYHYTGDTLTLRTYIENACAKLDDAYSVYGTNPGLGFYGWDERLGAGFENPDCQEAQSAYKMLSIRAWKAFAAAMSLFGRMDLANRYSGYADEKIAQLRQNPAWYQDFGLHAAADAVTTTLLNPVEEQALFERNFTDRVNRVSFSPFNQYFVIQAFAGMNKHDDALSSIRDLWGGQIQYGGTTFFEDYRPSWNEATGANGAVPNNQAGYTSLCHPWGGGVVKWLSEEVLGIKPVTPGFATYEILPHLGRTLTYVSGKTPTPLGEIRASFNVVTGLCTLSTPVGTVGRIGIPKVEKTITSITVNGATVWDGMYHAIAGLGGANEDSAFIYLNSVQPGTYCLKVSYSGSTLGYSEPPVQYAARFVKEDSTTSGNWGSRYGQDGFVLFNYNGNGNHIQAPPTYVSSVTYPSGGIAQPNLSLWATGTTDQRAPAADESNTGPRNAACLFSADPVACRQTFTVTVAIKGTREYQVGLYFLDWDNRGRRLAVEMFDANTLNIIAPVKMVRDFDGGKYLFFTYDKSAKFRIQQVRGDNAVLSGMFFDPAPIVGARENCLQKAGDFPVRISLHARKADIAFNTARPLANVTISMVDLRGRTVLQLLNSEFDRGDHNVKVNIPRLPAGVYTLQVRNEGKLIARKLSYFVK